ncbi:MAG: DUF4783 domain-containing protein [Bacteroidetes bacterium]|nr:DUF4783 domain-containing protein [Bacteroidota bacterium]MCB9042530.1 DUF4783 domain-containing protein [Chitinophagales bacterium]
MKLLRIFLVVIFGLLLFMKQEKSYSQTNISAIGKAIEQNDPEKLGTYMASNILLTINGNENNTVPTEAVKMLTTFFENNPPQKVTIKHNGNSSDGSKYAIGEMRTSNETLRTYMVFENDELVELCFDKE